MFLRINQSSNLVCVFLVLDEVGHAEGGGVGWQLVRDVEVVRRTAGPPPLHPHTVSTVRVVEEPRPAQPHGLQVNLQDAALNVRFVSLNLRSNSHNEMRV